jgi:hypothetical protein
MHTLCPILINYQKIKEKWQKHYFSFATPLNTKIKTRETKKKNRKKESKKKNREKNTTALILNRLRMSNISLKTNRNALFSSCLLVSLLSLMCINILEEEEEGNRNRNYFQEFFVGTYCTREKRSIHSWLDILLELLNLVTFLISGFLFSFIFRPLFPWMQSTRISLSSLTLLLYYSFS